MQHFFSNVLKETRMSTTSFISAPGVYFTENDESQYSPINSGAPIAGLVGVAPKGPVNQKVLVTTYAQLVALFGIPNENYPALLAAREFFNNGGIQLWFVRVTDDTDVAATTSIPMIGSGSLAVEAITSGSYFNNLQVFVAYGSQRSQTKTASEALTVTSTQTFMVTMVNAPLVPGTVYVSFGGTQLAKDNGSGALTFSAQGTTYSGTVNYNTGVVTFIAANIVSVTTLAISITSSYYSTFQIQSQLNLYDVNDNLINSGVPMETLSGLTLATAPAALANSNFLYTASNFTTFPTAGTYTMSGGTDGTSEIEDVDYIGNLVGSPTGLSIFGFPDSFLLDVIAIPGVTSASVRQALIQMCSQTRQDCICLLDPPSNSTVETVMDWADATGSFSAYGVINSTYAAIGFPWYTSNNDLTNGIDLTPPSVAILAACAKSLYYEAPAGPINGVVTNYVDVAYDCSPGDRVTLGQDRINPICNYSNLGLMVLGQYTATLTSSALNRIGARRTLLTIERTIVTNCRIYLFQPDFPYTWNKVDLLNSPYLEGLIDNQIIYAGSFECDGITNTTADINNNVMAISVNDLELAKYAESIDITFNLTAEGAEITESAN
jgi:hypothetical protein